MKKNKEKRILYIVVVLFVFSFFDRGVCSESLYSFKGNEKVLDLCCGQGDSSLTLAKIVRKGAVVGVDFSMNVIEQAKNKHLQSPSHLSFKYKDLQDLTFSDKFDVVTCFSLNQCLYNQLDLLKKIYGVLKPEGHLDIKLVTKLPVAMQSAIKAVVTKERWLDYFLTFHPDWNFYKEEEYKILLEKLAYKTVELKRYPVDETFASIEKFQDFVLGWIPYFNVIPLDLRKEFMEDFTQRYLKIFPLDNEGKVHFLVEKLEILAQKI